MFLKVTYYTYETTLKSMFDGNSPGYPQHIANNTY